MNTTSNREIRRRAARKVAWRLVPLLLAMYTANYLDRVNLGTAALTMNKDLGLSAAAFGFATGIFSAGYIALQIPSNMALQRVGPRRWLSLLMICWGVVATCTGFVTGEGSLVFVRILLGAAEAGFLPGMLLYLTYWFAPTRRGLISVLSTLPFYAVLGTPLSAIILQHADGLAGLAGWRWMFVFEGLPSILFGVLILLWLTDSPAKADWLTPEERAAVLAEVEDGAQDRPRIRLADLTDRMRDGRLMVFATATGMLWIGFAALTAFLPLIIAGFAATYHTKFSLVQTGLVTSVVYLPAIAAALFWARHSDRSRERVWHSAAGALVAAVGVLITINGHSLPITLIGTTLLTAGIYASLSLMWQLPIQHLRPGVAVAVGVAFTTTLGNIASFASPYVVGWLRDASGNYNSGLYFVAIALTGCAVLTVAAKRLRGPGERPDDEPIIADPQHSASN
ncbi:MFS transporter [Saccharopolyspora phatthalungensis]|uniref:ACS family tartrate transporter-like MFS transporter n=1 Tax=Saccharopolyspora phatthalungensis TaxID=664693 RepID=A0A840Q8E5_9PSEU|nr:MFS transporter [Saccharopolyspora phatthalungensis]MBB5157004.1 ACS family tartrate transporter-like MFS transporter [Saccharopolyspora phatthalungensis]